jgi:hypothetical protein
MRRLNCNTCAFEALQGNRHNLLMKVKIVSQIWTKCIYLFLNYVPMQSVAVNVERRMARRLLNSVLERMWKETAGVYFEILFCRVWRNWGKPTKWSLYPVWGPRSQLQSSQIGLRTADVPIANLGASLDIIKPKSLFVFGTTAPSVPGPPHSRGF